MRRYLGTADGALSVPDMAISRSFSQIFPHLGYSIVLELRWIQLFS
jgi:hypothetical protein